MYTVKEASQILGLEESHIRRLAKLGKIKAQKWGRDWMILELSYSRKRKQGGGRKRKEVRNEEDKPKSDSQRTGYK
ncbi:MAG: helix-turn-helix domain-containing protein [Dehalococcoidales bacterium]|nr:helix-turn-helix domain-containing protein [Dehalococcoidales bacterium]